MDTWMVGWKDRWMDEVMSEQTLLMVTGGGIGGGGGSEGLRRCIGGCIDGSLLINLTQFLAVLYGCDFLTSVLFLFQ